MIAPPENNNESTIKELQYQVSRYEDPAAYKALFFLLFPSLQNFSYSIIKSRVAAEEIASDILLEVWLRREKLMEIDNLRLYLFVSTKNASVARLKQENKHSQFQIESLDVEFVSDYIGPHESTELHELEQVIANTVKQLPPSCQLIYKLAKEDRLRYKDIAQLLDLSVKTIDNQLAIALKRIAEALRIHSAKKTGK